MGESENLHCEHDIRNKHVRYSTNMSTKTKIERTSFFEYRKMNIKLTYFFEYRKTKNKYRTNFSKTHNQVSTAVCLRRCCAILRFFA